VGPSLPALIANLQPDDWRAREGFSEDIAAANEELFACPSDAARVEVLQRWLQKHQPCLFGRLAAKNDLLSVCVLTEDDYSLGDQHVRAKIQAARLQWTESGFRGKKSGFIIAAVSPTLATCKPGLAARQVAERLCALYLERDIPLDTILHDEIYLERPGEPRHTWAWKVGINYFASSADKRWWHDHRIPGGIAFSMNSVGHMVKSGLLAKATQLADELLGDPGADGYFSVVDSLGKALGLAMRTIHLAAKTPHGQATRLLDLPAESSSVPSCPIELPTFLTGKNHCEYAGYYHTDYTLPACYFTEDVSRPAGLSEHMLDFTYLFHNDAENPDHRSMGIGRRIRSGTSQSIQWKNSTGTPLDMAISDSPLLLAALGMAKKGSKRIS
jgi:hypothetical protein